MTVSEVEFNCNMYVISNYPLIEVTSTDGASVFLKVSFLPRVSFTK